MINNFWRNILRYPSFFVTSVAGLILIILTPFKNLFKTNKYKYLIIILILLVLFGLYLVIANMLNI